MTTLSSCLREILGEAPPLELSSERQLDAWLKGRNLGFVRPVDPARFQWPGHWIALLSDGEHVVMFGVPSGVVFGSGAGEIAEALVLCPLDLHRGWSDPYRADLATGRVEAIMVADDREAPVRLVERALVTPDGITGDRYGRGAGTFSSPGATGVALTLVSAEVLAETGVSAEEARRSIVTSGIALEGLIGHEFAIGAVRCRGARLAEPCAHLQRLGRPGMLRSLVHRGGIRVDVLTPGEIAVGDPISVG